MTIEIVGTLFFIAFVFVVGWSLSLLFEKESKNHKKSIQKNVDN